MSLRAELVRFCLPWFMRPRFPSDIQIEDVRRRVARFAHLVPPPPRGTELIVVDAGGVKAERIATPRSLPNRYVLYLHGGALLPSTLQGAMSFQRIFDCGVSHCSICFANSRQRVAAFANVALAVGSVAAEFQQVT